MQKECRSVARFDWLLLAGAVVIYAALGLRAYDQPGVYMDAVNPDYLAARMATGLRQTTLWILPGNDLLHGRLPVLAGGLYHGSLHAYLTLPFFVALGGSVFSLRLAHLFLGIVIIAAVFAFVRETTRARWATAAALALLVSDPAFIFTFRTQAYITTLPVAFVLVALVFLHRDTGERKHALAAGVLLGLAVWGYFIYAFMLPGIAGLVLWDRCKRGLPAARGLWGLMIGVAIGTLPYTVGYTLVIVKAGGIGGGLAWLQQALTGLAVDSGESYADRVGFVIGQIGDAVTAQWHQSAVFANGPPLPAAGARLMALTALPVLALPFAIADRRTARGYWMIAAAMISFIASATVFGGRLGGHHFCLLVPMLSALAAVSLAILAAAGKVAKPLLATAGAIAVAGLVVVNIVGWQSITTRLAVEGGQRLYSRIIADYPRSVVASGDRTPHLFADWGALLPFIYLTEGRVPAYQEPLEARTFCRFPLAKVVFLGAGGADRGRQALLIPDLRIDAIDIHRDPWSGFAYTVFSVAYMAPGCRRG